MPSGRHVLLLDLVDEAEAIARYEAWHAAGAVPREIVHSIRDAGIISMDIYRSGTRLVMVMETDESFDPAAKAAADAANPAVIDWETRMSGRCPGPNPAPNGSKPRGYSRSTNNSAFRVLPCGATACAPSITPAIRRPFGGGGPSERG